MQARGSVHGDPKGVIDAVPSRGIVNGDIAPLVHSPAGRPGLREQKPNTVPDCTIDEILVAAGDLAVLPHVVLKLIQMTGDPSVNAIDLEKAILTDQAVAAKVLALANSAYFGLPRRVISVREAVVFLGFKTVRNLAMTVSAINMFFGRSDALSIARAQLWHHSLDVALVSRLIAECLHRSKGAEISSEEAFTAGLLHDIGKMVLDLSMPHQYLSAVHQMNEQGVRLLEIEADLFPFGHSAIGAHLATKWDLPASLCDVIEHHHDPENSAVYSELVAVVALANEIAHAATLIEGVELVAEAATSVHEGACTTLRIEVAELANIMSCCRVELEKGTALHNFM